MKVFSFTFILYIVLLLTQPCQDFAATLADNRDADAQVTHMERSSETDTSSGEECSPFCVCSCCSHPVNSHNFASVITHRADSREISTIIDDYVSPYDSVHPNSIWQPPKA